MNDLIHNAKMLAKRVGISPSELYHAHYMYGTFQNHRVLFALVLKSRHDETIKITIHLMNGWIRQYKYDGSIAGKVKIIKELKANSFTNDQIKEIMGSD